MSADNYYFVGKLEDGSYAVSHRYASMYYSDEVTEPPMEAHSFEGSSEGWRTRGDSENEGRVFATYEELMTNATRRPDWIEPPPTPRSTHDSLGEAIMQAHKYVSEDYVVEYGVIVQEGLL